MPSELKTLVCPSSFTPWLCLLLAAAPASAAAAAAAACTAAVRADPFVKDGGDGHGRDDGGGDSDRRRLEGEGTAGVRRKVSGARLGPACGVSNGFAWVIKDSYCTTGLGKRRGLWCQPLSNIATATAFLRRGIVFGGNRVLVCASYVLRTSHDPRPAACWLSPILCLPLSLPPAPLSRLAPRTNNSNSLRC